MYPFFKSNSEMQLASFLFYSKIHLTLMDAFSTRYLILNWVSWPSSCCCLYRWCLRFELFQVASGLGGYRCKFFREGVCTFFFLHMLMMMMLIISIFYFYFIFDDVGIPVFDSTGLIPWVGLLNPHTFFFLSDMQKWNIIGIVYCRTYAVCLYPQFCMFEHHGFLIHIIDMTDLWVDGGAKKSPRSESPNLWLMAYIWITKKE